MKSDFGVFAAVSLFVLAIQLITHIVILQITFGFAHETLFWQAASAAMVGFVGMAIVAHFRKPAAATAD